MASGEAQGVMVFTVQCRALASTVYCASAHDSSSEATSGAKTEVISDAAKLL